MKKLALALATGTLLLSFAGPAEAAVARPTAAVAAPTGDQALHRHRHWRWEPCYGPHPRYRHGECYDERYPQNDGGGSILF